MLKSWLVPFQEAFTGKDKDTGRVEVVQIQLVEGWFGSKLLKPFIRRQAKTNTPLEEHGRTLICFRNELEDFRDALRMHNIMTGYVFLLDGVGRVRFAGSGETTPEDVASVIRFADELTPLAKKTISKDSKQRRNKGSRSRE